MADVILDSQWVRQANLLPKRTQDGPKGISQNSMTVEQMQLRRYTSAAFKFTNTTLGGNFALNMPPQPCRFADPVPPRFVVPKVPGGKEEWGMSRWYSENIDDLSVLLHMRFGVPAYNSMWGFFSNFYNPDDARLVRTGRDFSIGSFIGRALGWVFSIRLLPLIWTGQAIKFFTSVTSTRFAYLKPTMGLYWKYVNDVANTIAANLDITAKADASYYKLAENFQRRGDTTNSQTSASQSEVNSSATGGDAMNRPVYQVTDENIADIERSKSEGVNGSEALKAASSLFAFSASERNFYRERLPEIYQSDGLTGINVYAVVLRAQAMADAWNRKILELEEQSADTGNNAGLVEAVRNWIMSGEATDDLENQLSTRSKTVEDFLGDEYYSSTYGGLGKTTAELGSDQLTAKDAGNPNIGDILQANTERNKDEQSTSDSKSEATVTETSGNVDPQKDLIDKLKNYASYAYENINTLLDASNDNYESLKRVFKAAQHDGSQFLTLRVNGRDSVSESFSNSTRPSDIGNMMNSTSASARNMLLNLGDGNFKDFPVIGPMVQQIAGMVGAVFTGAADSLRLSGVGALMGNAFVDIPEHYDASQAQFNQMSYTIHLRAPYGNDHSRFQNEILPLACLIAAILPRSTGPGSYGLPWHCEAYCRGRGQSRFAIPVQLDITRGVANMPWTEDGRWRGVDVRLTLKDLSSVMHVGMNEVSGFRAIDPTRWGTLLFPQDSSISDYTAVLASMGLGDQIYKMNKLKRNWKALAGSFEKWWSPQARAVGLFSGLTGQVLSSFSHTERR